MTRIDEQAFSIDLPGQWESVESEDPGSSSTARRMGLRYSR